MLSGLGVGLGLGVEGATSALQEEIGAFAAREFRLRSGITCHFTFLCCCAALAAVSPPRASVPAGRTRWSWKNQIRRFLGGRQPLCGTGVTSEIDRILMPSAFSARTEESRPGPGPLIRTSRFLMPYSMATRPAASAATWAANGVDLREPRKPAPPEVAHDSVLPWRSVIVMIVLLIL